MNNFEKFSNDIDTTLFAVVKGKPVDCDGAVDCDECDLFCKDVRVPCVSKRMEWLKSEYEEPKINIPEGTNIDTKVLVSDDGITWDRRYYAGKKNGKHYAWFGGQTSWSSDPDSMRSWEYMKLYE